MGRQHLVSSITLIAALGVTTQELRATDVKDVTPIETRPYSFPAYDQVEGIGFYASRDEYQNAIGDHAFEFQKLVYRSDGLKVISYLYRPRQAGKKWPAIIFNRGSGPAGDTAPLLISLFHRLALRGFVVLAPQYRGSDGGEGRDEMGGADLNDVKNMILVAQSLGFVDMNNLFMYGESRGGMMTYQAIRDATPIRAAAVFGAFTDLEIMLQSPREQAMIAQLGPIMKPRRERSSEDDRPDTGRSSSPSRS